jgi:hypothetical protein
MHPGIVVQQMRHAHNASSPAQRSDIATRFRTIGSPVPRKVRVWEDSAVEPSPGRQDRERNGPIPRHGRREVVRRSDPNPNTAPLTAARPEIIAPFCGQQPARNTNGTRGMIPRSGRRDANVATMGTAQPLRASRRLRLPIRRSIGAHKGSILTWHEKRRKKRGRHSQPCEHRKIALIRPMDHWRTALVARGEVLPRRTNATAVRPPDDASYITVHRCCSMPHDAAVAKCGDKDLINGTATPPSAMIAPAAAAGESLIEVPTS